MPMSPKSVILDERLYRYLLDHSLDEHPLLAELREETARDPMARERPDVSPVESPTHAAIIRNSTGIVRPIAATAGSPRNDA